MKKYSKEDCIDILEEYDEHLRENIKQYCDPEDIPYIHEFIEGYLENDATEEELKEIMEDYKSTLRCHTSQSYSDKEMKFYENREGKPYVKLSPFEFLKENNHLE